MYIGLLVLFGFLLFLVVLIQLGPRVPVDTTLRPLHLPEDLEAYLAETESSYPDIVPGTEKTISWAHPDKRRTRYAMVYLHGFSASRRETVPLSDQLAESLEANLFYTRLTGHARGGPAMAEASINDWLNDAAEALAIGRRLGEKVIVISLSTGSTLAAWTALQDRLRDVHCHIMLSPNFAVRDRRSKWAARPWGAQLVRLMVGKEYQSKVLNEAHERYWTTRYPSSALAVLCTLVRFVRESPLERITCPVLVIYSIHDQVVDPGEIERAFRRFGSPQKELYRIEEPNETGNHVLAGDILAPEGTERIETVITEFVRGLD